MKITHLRPLFIALSLGLAGPALAHGAKLGDLTIIHPAMPQPAVSAKTAGGYFTLRNGGAQPDRLIAIESDIAEKTELHTTDHGADGVARMRHVEALEIPAGGEVALERGGYHVMFMGLKAPLSLGAMVPATLVFERAGRVAVEFAVEEPRAAGEDHTGHGSGHGSGHGAPSN